ncbi:MAG: indolepyruvate oxidoreductase subunit beta [Clostridia bacterium]|nr:indolepyruvate oxidoreductase subunit beta [Clostridia bacterium]
MANSLNVMIVGVGGQGTLLASRLLGSAMIQSGYDVKVSEVHGMSQRGGSVVTYVKAGENVCSPTIEKGEADIILSFEQLEAARWLPYLKKGGKIIVNTQSIDPMPVVIGAAKYPEDVLCAIGNTGVEIISMDALKLALEAGSAKATNVVLLGAMAKYTGIDYEIFENAVKETVPAKFLDMNLQALKLGYEA